jgi:enediyne biosynthesis protein E4
MPKEPRKHAKRGPAMALALVGVAGVTALVLESRHEPQLRPAPAAESSAAAASKAPALEAMARSVLETIEKQESAKDATCWTTVRMIESFSIGLQLAPAAELARIDGSRQLLLHLWRQASDKATSELLGEAQIDAVLPAEAKKELPALQVTDQAPIPVDQLGLRDHHKTTDNWRTLYSALLQQMAQPTPLSLKTLDAAGAQMLTRSSSAMTGLLLRESARVARERNHERVELEDVQGGYQALEARLFGGAKQAPAPSESTLDQAAFTSMRKLTESVVLGKLRALRTYNKLGSPDSYEDLNLLADYLGKVVRFPVKPDGAAALVAEVQQFAELFLSAEGPFRSDAFADSLRGLEAEKRSKTPKAPRLVRVSDVFNAAQNLFPTHKLPNGDAEVYLVQQVMDKPDSPARFEERRLQLFAPSMDSIRDTGLHWLVLQRALKNTPHVALDPFAAEYLTEAMAEYGFFLLHTAVEFAQENKKPAVVKEALAYSPWKYPRARILPDPKLEHDPKATLDPELRATVRAKYPAALFKERASPAVWTEACTEGRTGFQGFMGSGFAVGDFDADGKVDVFTAADGCNRLLKNEGGYRFTDVTEQSGIKGLHVSSRQPIFVDFDGDGGLDLFVTQSDQPSRLFARRGDRYVDVTDSMGLRTRTGAHNAHFFDYDRDGDLDLFIGYYGPSQGNTAVPTLDGRNGYANQLLRNDGARFSDVSEKAGVASTAWTLASAAVDYDQDGWLDFWLANDWGKDELFRNKGDGTFEEVAGKLGVDDRGSGMNASVLDFNHDSRPDTFVSMIEMFSKTLRFILPTEGSSFNVDDRILKSSYYIAGNKLFLGAEGGGFDDQTGKLIDARDKGWAWGAAFFDLENDGDDDMYLANGWIANSAFAKQRNQLLINDADRLIAFSPDINEKLTSEARFPESYLGSSRAVAAVDLTGSGKSDLLVLDYELGLRVLENVAPRRGKHLRVKLVGSGKNKDAIGASVRVFAKGLPPSWRMSSAGSDYLSQTALPLLFGTGNAEVERIVVRWPNGRESEHQGPFEQGKTVELRQAQ